MMDTYTLLLVAVVGCVFVVQGAPLSEQEEGDLMLLRLLQNVMEEDSKTVEKKEVNVADVEDLRQRATSFDGQLQSLELKVMGINNNIEAMQRALLEIADRVNDQKDAAGRKADALDARQAALEEELGRVVKPVETKSALDGLDQAYRRELDDLRNIKRMAEEMYERNQPAVNPAELPYEK